VKLLASILISLLILATTSGCWDNNELDEYGYVQAVAIDQEDDKRIQVTTHFYNPSSKMEQTGTPGSGKKGINMRTTGETFFEAMRDIPSEFGRKSKWDHMRVILIGEQLARKMNIREVLDFFSRDHEPRGTILPIIAENKASQFLEIQPFIEQTIGQQFKKMETSGSMFSGKTSNIPLYDLAIQMKSPSKTSAIPFLHFSSEDGRAIITGVALIKNGKMVGTLKGKDTEAFMMMTSQYKDGILEFPCLQKDSDHTHDKESFEVVDFKGELTPTIKDNEIIVTINLMIEGNVGELRCSNLRTKQDITLYEQAIKDRVEQRLQHAVSILNRQKVDALGIGTKIYRKHPKQWKKLEPTWDNQLAQIHFNYDVHIKVLSTGMNTGTIFGTKEK